MLGYEELSELEEALSIWGLEHLLHHDTEYRVYRTGKIIVIGQSDVQKDVLLSIANKAGVEKSRFELYLDYQDTKRFDFRKTQWDPSYSVILVGSMPHSGKTKGDASSVITAIENVEGYPPVIRLGANTLKITKRDFKQKLQELIEVGKIVRH